MNNNFIDAAYVDSHNGLRLCMKNKWFTGIMTFPNGSYECFSEGFWHNEDGPAVVNYLEDGSIEKNYYLNGEQYSFQEFWDKQKATKYANKIMANVLGTE